MSEHNHEHSHDNQELSPEEAAQKEEWEARTIELYAYSEETQADLKEVQSILDRISDRDDTPIIALIAHKPFPGIVSMQGVTCGHYSACFFLNKSLQEQVEKIHESLLHNFIKDTPLETLQDAPHLKKMLSNGLIDPILSEKSVSFLSRQAKVITEATGRSADDYEEVTQKTKEVDAPELVEGSPSDEG